MNLISRRYALKAAAGAAAGVTAVGLTACAASTSSPRPTNLLITADHMFDGRRFIDHAAVATTGGTITASGPVESVPAPPSARRIELGAATLLPGMIDLHVHATFRHISFERILAHGVTTIRDLGATMRDLGGHLPVSQQAPGTPRRLAAGPMITVEGGYPIPVFGRDAAAVVTDPDSARATVADLIARGADIIKIALDPGGEHGAPWSYGAKVPPPWPMLSLDQTRAIVEEAHRHDRVVTAHLGEEQGARIALGAGVDEWAHSPCQPLPDDLLGQAAAHNVAMVGTLDTESHATGQLDNARSFIAHGGTLLYGTDMAHPEIPHGVDSHELMLMMAAGLTLEQALAGATSRAGQHLRLAPLGTLDPGAPADLIAAAGDPRTGPDDLKNLEYPLLVAAGGRLVVEPPTAGQK